MRLAPEGNIIIYPLFIILLFLFIYLLKKKNIEGFHNLIDPRYHTLSLYNRKDFYKRFMDYF